MTTGRGGSPAGPARPVGFRDRYGPWAVVVGGSEGLGSAFADALAASGLSVVLVARRRAVLQRAAARLRADHGVEVMVLALDAGAPRAPGEILRRTRHLDVGLLVCSAASAPVGPFLDLEPAALDRMIALNCRAPARLAHGFGRRLAARGRGGIVLVSSMAGLQGGARIAHYAATKAYGRVLAEGLWAELRERGVDVVAPCPGRVRTPTWERGAPRAAGYLAPPVMEPAPVVRATLAALGREPVVIPGRLNRWSAVAAQLLPRRTAVALVSAATRAMYPAGPTGSRRPAPPGGSGA